MSIQISLTQSQVIVTTPQVTKTISTLTIERMVDNPQQQFVRVFIAELNNPITLWTATSSPSYSQIGQWSNQDVENALVALYGGTSSVI